MSAGEDTRTRGHEAGANPVGVNDLAHLVPLDVREDLRHVTERRAHLVGGDFACACISRGVSGRPRRADTLYVNGAVSVCRIRTTIVFVEHIEGGIYLRAGRV